MYAGAKALLNPAQGRMSDTGQAEMGQLIWLPFVVTWGKWNVNSLVGMEPEQVREVKRSQLGIIGLTYLHNAGSGKEFSERWLTLSFFEVAQDERHRACVGALVSPQLSAAVLGVLRGKQEGLLYANASCFRYSWTGSQVAAVEWSVQIGNFWIASLLFADYKFCRLLRSLISSRHGRCAAECEAVWMSVSSWGRGSLPDTADGVEVSRGLVVHKWL